MEVTEGVYVIRKIKREERRKTLDWIPAARRTLKMIGRAMTLDERKAVRKFLFGAQAAYAHLRNTCRPDAALVK